jgi:lipoprotein-releasing system ATP-binding protein
MKDDLVLTIEDLHKSFRKGPEVIEVLKGIDLDVHKSEGIAIVGASGSGKSTLLHLLGGLEKPDSGTIIYGTSDISAMKDREIARFRNTKIGFVFQFHYLLPEFTALENVMVPALLSANMSGPITARAEELLDLVGLKGRTTHKPGELSGGEQQRVAIARALMIIELFTGLRTTLNVTLIIATHNMELARTMDRVLVLKGGHLEPTAQ